jgi:LmbE family N-acetylglucosaminyl deacetylase
MRVLAVGAHPDDIELGCGATLARHRALGHEVTMCVLTTGERGPQHSASRLREQEDAAAILGADLVWGSFADGEVAHDHATVAFLDQVMREVEPDVVYAHGVEDSHQDHVAAAKATRAAARHHNRLLTFASPTTTEFDPTLFVDVEGFLDVKRKMLEAHWSQVIGCGLVDLEALEATATYWGRLSRLSKAEPFETFRFEWDLTFAETKAEAGSGEEVVDLMATGSGG